MTAKELIAELGKLPQDLPVYDGFGNEVNACFENTYTYPDGEEIKIIDLD